MYLVWCIGKSWILSYCRFCSLFFNFSFFSFSKKLFFHFHLGDMVTVPCLKCYACGTIKAQNCMEIRAWYSRLQIPCLSLYAWGSMLQVLSFKFYAWGPMLKVLEMLWQRCRKYTPRRVVKPPRFLFSFFKAKLFQN